MLKVLLGSSGGGSGSYTEQQKLLASDQASYDYFGYSVGLSSEGNTAIIGAYGESTSPNVQNGAVYIFTRVGATWSQQQKLLANDRENSALFGNSVAISADGNTVLIGAIGEDTSPNTDNGAAYVFTRSGTTWTQQSKLTASDAATADVFGRSVSLSSNGDTAIVGARLEDTSPSSGNGAAYVFTRSGGSWTEQQKLTASDAESDDFFGTSVALSADGNTAIVGATGEDTSPEVLNGAAYVFTRSGSVWTQQQKLTASDLESSASFGTSVSLSSDGNTAIVGADGEDTSPNTNNGAAYVFTRSGSVWTQQQKLLASDAASGDLFGVSVSLSADGNIAVIGAWGEDTAPESANGAAYVFTRTGSTWAQQQKLVASDLVTGDYFGFSTSISSDGSIVLIGAYGEGTSPSVQNGAAYVFAS